MLDGPAWQALAREDSTSEYVQALSTELYEAPAAVQQDDHFHDLLTHLLALVNQPAPAPMPAPAGNTMPDLDEVREAIVEVMRRSRALRGLGFDEREITNVMHAYARAFVIRSVVIFGCAFGVLLMLVTVVGGWLIWKNEHGK